MSDTKVYQIDGDISSISSTSFIEQAKISNQDVKKNMGWAKIIKKTNVNPYSNYFPVFYSKELKGYKHGVIYWTVAFIILLTFMSLAAGFTIQANDPQSFWLLIIYILPILVFTPCYIIHINRFTSLRQEAQTINFKDQKTLSINILKLYKRLKVTHINANWFCSLSYLLCVLAFLSLIIAVWSITGFSNAFDYKNWTANPLSSILQYNVKYPQFFIAFITIVIIFISSILIHVSSITSSYLRVNRIENYYNSFIVIPEEIDQLKKKTNRRDLIIFLLCALVIGLIIYFFYKKTREAKEKQSITIRQ